MRQLGMSLLNPVCHFITGASPSSVQSSDFTSAEKPSSPPPSHEIVPKTATSLNITWSLPPAAEWNGQLTNTRIWYVNHFTFQNVFNFGYIQIGSTF